MKRVLVLNFFPAFTPPSSGGELRLFHLYHELSRHHHVTLLSSTYHGRAEERYMHGPRFVERRIPKCDEFNAVWQELKPMASGGDMSAAVVAASGERATPLHRAYLEEYTAADVIVHDFPFTLPYDLFIGLDSKPRIYNSHNCESALIRQLHPASHSAPLHHLVDRLEADLLRHADLVGYCAEPDLRAFEALVQRPLANTVSLPNGFTPRAGAERRAIPAGRPRALFIGSGHKPNLDAALFIATELAPLLPGCDFDIAGECLPPGAYPPNVLRHGGVDAATKSALLDSAWVTLNPTTVGSGSNLKVLEFLGAGLPVLSTAFGVRGIDVEHGIDCAVAPREEFAAALRALLADPAQAEAMGDRGRKKVEGRYAWRTVAQHLSQAIEKLSPRDAGPLDRPFVLGLNDYDPFAAVGGGGLRIQELVAGLDRQRPVVYIAFADDGRLSRRALFEQSVFFTVPKSEEHRAEERRTAGLHHVSVADAVALEHAERNPWLLALYRALRGSASIVVCDHPYMARLPLAHGDRVVYSSQNHESLLKKESLQCHPERDRWLGLIERTERELTRHASLLVAVSDDDAQTLLQGHQAGPPTIVVRNGARGVGDIEPADLLRARRTVRSPSALFVGSAHMPNVEACQFIIRELAPVLPEVQFHLLGSAGKGAGGPTPSNVVVWGSVSESLKSAVMTTCSVAINPMFSGGGSNIKLADYLAHGLHVLSTPFGRRGYTGEADTHLTLAEREQFSAALLALLDRPGLNEAALREARRGAFERQFAMRTLSDGFARAVVDIDRPRRRVLFVTYRWLWPVRGGGEAHLLQHLAALVESERFEVDVVAPDIAEFIDHSRFATETTSARDASAPFGLPRVRFRRFDTQTPSARERLEPARRIWDLQPAFERELYERLDFGTLKTGLAWGWGWSEAGRGRWAMASFGLHLSEGALVEIAGGTDQSGALLVSDRSGRQIAHVELSSPFALRFEAPAGAVHFEVSAVCRVAEDARPLGLFINSIRIDGAFLDMSAPLLVEGGVADAVSHFERFHQASQLTRHAGGVSLTDVRGPFSPGLEDFVRDHVAEYDLVLTHNAVFRTAVVAVEHARRAGVPVAILPHAHLDDDYYHFPDVTAAVANADLVMAAPMAACEFYRRRGARRVAYMTPACDASEPYSDEDEQAFRALWPHPKPFVLVLGRKAAAKGWRQVVAAIESLGTEHEIELVMIGPDDDRQPINSPGVSYLGAQPRNVVRGALRACLALVNMSVSESFGMVLLEAWLADKPVIVNRNCAAFADIARHGHNALLADDRTLASAIRTLLLRPAFAVSLGRAGHLTAMGFDRRVVDRRFVDLCDSLCHDAPLGA